jgi:hypothetical protein
MLPEWIHFLRTTTSADNICIDDRLHTLPKWDNVMRQLRLADGWASRSCVPLSRLIRLPSRRLEPGAAMVHLGKRVKGEHIRPVARFDERRHSSHLIRPGEDSRPV